MITDPQTFLRIPSEPQQIFHIDPTRHLEQQKTYSLAPYEDAFFNFLELQYNYMSFAIESANSKLWFLILNERANNNGIIADHTVLSNLPIVEQFAIRKSDITIKDQYIASLHEQAVIQNIKRTYDSFVSYWQYSLSVFHYNIAFWYYFYFLREGQTDTKIQENTNKFRSYWRDSFYDYRDYLANKVFNNGSKAILDIDHTQVYNHTSQYINDMLNKLKEVIEKFEILYI